MADQLENTARTIVRDWMLHLGYTEDQIALGDADPDHSLCVLGENGWYCLDENEEDRHPIHGEMGEVAELIMFVLQHGLWSERSDDA